MTPKDAVPRPEAQTLPLSIGLTSTRAQARFLALPSRPTVALATCSPPTHDSGVPRTALAGRSHCRRLASMQTFVDDDCADDLRSAPSRSEPESHTRGNSQRPVSRDIKGCHLARTLFFVVLRRSVPARSGLEEERATTRDETLTGVLRPTSDAARRFGTSPKIRMKMCETHRKGHQIWPLRSTLRKASVRADSKSCLALPARKTIDSSRSSRSSWPL